MEVTTACVGVLSYHLPVTEGSPRETQVQHEIRTICVA
jgi:hypothetical protein